jgi:DNA-binding PadR family transcriptional regulator
MYPQAIYASGMAEPLREPTYYVLAALLDGPLHGYAIAQAAADLSGGDVTLPAGTLYGALDRLVKRGLLRHAGDEVIAGRRRRAYELTGDGRATLLAEARRMRHAAAVVERHGKSFAAEARRA